MTEKDFVLDMMEWLRGNYSTETSPDVREGIIDAIESITMQAIVSDVFERPEEADGD